MQRWMPQSRRPSARAERASCHTQAKQTSSAVWVFTQRLFCLWALIMGSWLRFIFDISQPFMGSIYHFIL